MTLVLLLYFVRLEFTDQVLAFKVRSSGEQPSLNYLCFRIYGLHSTNSSAHAYSLQTFDFLKNNSRKHKDLHIFVPLKLNVIVSFAISLAILLFFSLQLTFRLYLCTRFGNRALTHVFYKIPFTWFLKRSSYSYYPEHLNAHHKLPNLYDHFTLGHHMFKQAIT